MAPAGSRISAPDLDFDADGKQLSWLRLPYSSNVSAYGWIPIPIAVIRNGHGPTALITAGNHGDEYEGQVAATKLIRSLDPSGIRGRLIVIPTLNAPAAQAGLRTSPIDGLNLNRAFPGDRDGTPTQMIAHYVESVLLPMADYAFDLHSGGRTLIYLPSALIRLTGNARLDAEARALLEIFGAPVGYIARDTTEDRTLMAAAHRQGVVALGTELGGGGMVGSEALRIAERALRSMLGHIGILPEAEAAPRTERLVEVGGADYYVYAPDRGVFEFRAELGEEVAAGQPLGVLHFVDNPGRESLVIRFQRAGLLLCKRFPGPCERGDCLGHLGTDLEA